jgi:Glycosyltransferase family 87
MTRRAGLQQRLSSELAASGSRHPRLRAAWRWFVRHRLWFVVGAALVVAFLDGRGSFEVQDPSLFVAAGKKLLSLHPLDAFADKTVQEGPLALAFWGLVGYVADLIRVDPRMVASLAINVGFTLAAVFTLRALLEERERPSADLEVFAAAILLLGGLTWTMLSTGHVAEGLIPLLWLHAARSARRESSQRAAILIGLATGLKLWGILGLPVLLLVPAGGLRKLAVSGVTAIGLSALFYAHLAFGATAPLHYEWEIAASSPIHGLFPDSTSFTWQMRVAQSATVVIAGAALAFALRGRRHADWAVPAALVGAKLLLDPIVFSYYPLSVQVLALVGAAALVAPWPAWVRLVGAGLLFLVLSPAWLFQGNLAGVVLLVVAMSMAVRLAVRPAPIQR